MLLTLAATADELSLSPRLVAQLVARREIPVRRIGRAVRVDRRDLEKYVDNLPREKETK